MIAAQQSQPAAGKCDPLRAALYHTKVKMISQLRMVLYLLQCLFPPVGSTFNIARLEAISNVQRGLFVESSGKLDRNYVGMTELIIGSTKYLVTTSLTTNRTFQLFLFNDLESLLSNRSINPPLELKVNDSSDNVLKPFQGADFIRLFNVGQHLYLMYATREQQFAELSMLEGNIYFNQRDVVVVDASNIPSECRNNLNNWTPIPSIRVRKGYVNFMFICSIYPHRVLPMMYKINSTTHVHVIFNNDNLDYQTVLSHEASAEYYIQLRWPYGKLECGTTPSITNTSQGQRFITFFWSAGITMGSSKMTFLGAYLFDNSPPLRITHFPADPVLIQPFLSKKLIPTGSKEINGSIFVMLGDGINSYWMFLGKHSFLKSLREVSSENVSETYVHQHFHHKITSSYYEIQFKLMQIQKRQYETFLIDEWQLIGVTRSPAVAYFNGSFIVVSCASTNYIHWGSFQCSYQQYSNFLSENYFNHTLILYNENTSFGLFAMDMRLIVINETRIYGVFSYVRPRKRNDGYHFDPFVSELIFTKSQLFAKEPTYLHISHDSSTKSQKNWTPFACTVSMTGLCFVQRMVPHTIVTFREKYFNKSIGYNNMVIIAQSSYSPTNLWVYGEPRGGSQAELVDTPYGRRYFAVFHSSQERGRGIKTYYSGGYLFRAGYPYDITHISVEPLAPASFYNISQAWAHRGMDFVVFPMSLIIRGDLAHVSFGVQDRAGYIVSLKLHSFFLTLKTVISRPRSKKENLTAY